MEGTLLIRKYQKTTLYLIILWKRSYIYSFVLCLKLFYHILELYPEYFNLFSQKPRQCCLLCRLYSYLLKNSLALRFNYCFYPCSEMFHTLPSDHCSAGNNFHFCRVLVAKPEFCKVHASLLYLLSFYHYVRTFAGNILYVSYFLRKVVINGILSCSGCCLAPWWPSAS